jgi:hypothetical protein
MKSVRSRNEEVRIGKKNEIENYRRGSEEASPSERDGEVRKAADGIE